MHIGQAVKYQQAVIFTYLASVLVNLCYLHPCSTKTDLKTLMLHTTTKLVSRGRGQSLVCLASHIDVFKIHFIFYYI